LEENPYIKRGIFIDQFEEQLKYLKGHYKIVHFSDLPDIEKDTPACILTFDDGLKECYTKVFPVLEKMNAKAVFFICSRIYSESFILTVQKSHILTSRLGQDEFIAQFYRIYNERHGAVTRENLQEVDYDEIYPYDLDRVRQFKLDLNYRLRINIVDDILAELFKRSFSESESEIVDEIYLSENQLKEVYASALVELGAHSHSHYLMSRLDVKEQEKEIKLSVDFLQDRIGCRIPVPFSYPFGRKGTYNQTTKEILIKDKRVGWACNMLRMNNNGIEDKFDIHRFDVNDIFVKGIPGLV
tara:strand:+ start:202 stop:1098 length:897 start_codon:yes stop_codon:yes gene_type:complete